MGMLAWWRPFRYLHGRAVDKRVTGAQAAATDLGVPFDAEEVRRALVYQRRRMRGIVSSFLVLYALTCAGAGLYYRAACTPGGKYWSGQARCESFETFLAGPGGHIAPSDVAPYLILAILAPVLVAWSNARAGEYIARRYRPLYPLLEVLTTSAAVATSTTAQHDEAVKLNGQAAELGVHLRTVARHMAFEFGNRKKIKAALAEHASRVFTAFSHAADGLVADRAQAARQLGTLAACAASNIAAWRFQEILPADKLPEDPAIEPDQLDGRRLTRACLTAAVAVAIGSALLAWWGAPVELLLPLALVAFALTAYLLLAEKYGLSEASRLTRSLMAFFSQPPQL